MASPIPGLERRQFSPERELPSAPLLSHDLAVTLLMTSLALYLSSSTFADPDLWGHLRFGGDTVAAGGPLRIDPYSYLSEGQTWINHEWLAEVSFWLAYQAAGVAGLVALKVAFCLFSVGLIYAWLLRCKLDAVRAALAVSVLAVLPLSAWVQTVRPQVFTLACFGVTLYALCAIDRPGTKRWLLWILPPVFALWTNLHGGFLAGIGVLVVWLVSSGAAVFRNRSDVSPAWRAWVMWRFAPVAAAVLSTLVNPYGFGLWSFLLKTATVPRPEIVEWLPLPLMTLDGLAYLAVLGVTGTALACSQRLRRPALMAVYLGMALAPFIAQRHLPLFLVAAVMISGEHLQDVWRRWSPGASVRPRRWWSMLSVAAATLLVWLSAPHFAQMPLVYRYPVQAVALIEQRVTGEANVAIDFDWGQYALWHLGPRVKVSVDGRRETVYGETIYQENLNFSYGRGAWDALIDGRRTDLALVRRDKPVYNLLRLKPGWLLVYEDRLCALFVAEQSPVRAQLEGATAPDISYDGAGLVFPDHGGTAFATRETSFTP